MDNKKPERLSALVRRFNGKRIAVVGDLMLDAYTWGKVSRISPEAPVPVVQITKQTYCLGGAANVMRNIVTLGGEVSAFGVVGHDHSGEKLKEQLEEYGIEYSGIFSDSTRPTILKQRVMAGAQQLLRIDDELLAPVSDSIRNEILQAVTPLLESGRIDALILEDYAKGLFSEAFAQSLIDTANRNHVMVTLDPNPKNPMRLKGLTIMKPNRAEAYALASCSPAQIATNEERMKELVHVASVIRREWQVKYLLISLAEQGMALFMENDRCSIIPTRAKEVFDVSGAGDTVIAASTLTLAVEDDPVASAEIANYAAGIVVGKLGTATVSSDELLAELSNG